MPTTPRRKGRPRGFNSDPSQSTIQALDRALEVLDLLSRNDGLSLSAIARALDQSAATMHRVLVTLSERGFVETGPAGQDWHVGPTSFRVGSGFLRRTNVFERSRPHMYDLMRTTGETSNLGIERNGNVLFIGQVETHDAIRAFFPPGTLSPLHASGIGKALLSGYSDERLERFLRQQPFERFTENTIVDAEALQTQVLLARALGYVVDDEERTVGMRCVAAPIFDSQGDIVAGISVSGPSQRMTKNKVETVGGHVGKAAQEITRQLGAPSPRSLRAGRV